MFYVGRNVNVGKQEKVDVDNPVGQTPVARPEFHDGGARWQLGQKSGAMIVGRIFAGDDPLAQVVEPAAHAPMVHALLLERGIFGLDEARIGEVGMALAARVFHIACLARDAGR